MGIVPRKKGGGGHHATVTAAVDSGKLGPPVPAAEPRRQWHPTPLGALIPRLVRPAMDRGRRGPATVQLVAAWEAIIGPAIAAVTVPRRLAAGTLTIACPGPVALELQHMTDVLLARVNLYFGRTAVSRIRLEQVAPAATAVAAKPPPQAAITAARALVQDVSDEALRVALEALGQAVLARRQGWPD